MHMVNKQITAIYFLLESIKIFKVNLFLESYQRIILYIYNNINKIRSAAYNFDKFENSGTFRLQRTVIIFALLNRQFRHTKSSEL